MKYTLLIFMWKQHVWLCLMLNSILKVLFQDANYQHSINSITLYQLHCYLASTTFKPYGYTGIGIHQASLTSL